MITILMIEDNRADARLVEFDLKSSSDEKIQITLVERVEEAKQALSDNEYDIILADLNLPDSKGMQSFRILTEAAPDLPIVLLTGNSDEELAGQLVKEGAEDYIVKGEVKGRYLVRAIHYAIERRAMSVRLREQNRQLEQMLQIDPLTGLFSRRHILSYLDDEIERHNRYGNHLSLILLDIDDFKLINDDYGHNAGDKALKTIAKHLRKSVRKVDKPARYGGDEFIILLPDSDIRSAEKVCRKLSSTPVSICINRETTIELSLSIGAVEAQGLCTATRLIDQADMAMFSAKKSGKGMYHIYRDDQQINGGESAEFLQDSRNSLRQVLCQVLGAVLNETERSHDIIDSASEIGQLFADQLLKSVSLSRDQIRTLKNALQIMRYVELNMPSDVMNHSEITDEAKKRLLSDRFVYNMELLRKIRFLKGETDILSSIHERYDGRGFPEGLSGDDIPLLARIASPLFFAARLFKSAEGKADNMIGTIIGHLEQGADTLYDREIAAVLVENLQRMKREYSEKGNGTLLLVDEESDNRSYLKRLLEKEGFSVETASGSNDTCLLLDNGHDWDVIIIDLFGSKRDGLEIVREVKGREKDSVVCVASSRMDKQLIEEAENAGADLYLIKPVRVRLLFRFLAVYNPDEKPECGMTVISGLSAAEITG